MIRIFFDDRCGMCAKEMAYYQQLTPLISMSWHPLSEQQPALDEANITLADALLLLHAQDEQGQWHVGLDAFVLLWSAFPRWRYLARIVRLPLIASIFKFCYRHFAACVLSVLHIARRVYL